ncbi:MAG TPA: hypothetical protein VM283_05880 [Armatimonadota bacterium]|nr:hypothetical protein [Armatimonadota bacterium]
MASSPRSQLRTGCRRGDPAALDALLYGTADEVYALALTAMADEEQAQECLRETWRRLLAALCRPLFNKYPQERVRRIAWRVVAERVGGHEAAAARRAVTGDNGTMGLDGVHAPEGVLEELSALSAEFAPGLRLRRRRRKQLLRGSIVGLFVIAVGVWSAVFYQRSAQSHDLAKLQYRCLRQRVIEQDLAATTRIAASQLEDPSGADRGAAADCERIILVFEEIANNDRLDTVSGLRYIRQRVARDELADFVRSLPRDSTEMQRGLPRVALALEEVQNL